MLTPDAPQPDDRGRKAKRRAGQTPAQPRLDEHKKKTDGGQPGWRRPYDVGAVSEGQAVGRLLRDIDTNDHHPDEPDDRWSRQPVGALPRSRRVGDHGAVPTERTNAVSFAGSGNEPVRWVTSTSGRGRSGREPGPGGEHPRARVRPERNTHCRPATSTRPAALTIASSRGC